MKKLACILTALCLMFSMVSCSSSSKEDGNVSTGENGKIDSDSKDGRMMDDIRRGVENAESDIVDFGRDMKSSMK